MLLPDFTPELKITENQLPEMKRKVFLFTNHVLSFCLRYFCCCTYLKTQLFKYYITHVIYINKKLEKVFLPSPVKPADGNDKPAKSILTFKLPTLARLLFHH